MASTAFRKEKHTHNAGFDIATCEACGAVISTSKEAAHKAWHEEKGEKVAGFSGFFRVAGVPAEPE